MASIIAVIALIGGTLMLYQFVRTLDKRVNLYYIFPGFFLLIHGIGFLDAKYLLSLTEYNELLADARIDEQDITIAFVAVIGVSLTAFLIGALIKSVFSFNYEQLRYCTERVTHSQSFVFVSACVVMAELWLLYSGGYGISGIAFDEASGRVSPFAQLIPPLMNCLAYFGGYMIKRRKYRLFAWSLLGTQLLYAFLGGRRSLFVALLSGYFGLRIAGVEVSKISGIKKALIGVAGACIFVVGFTFYQAIRAERSSGITATQDLTGAVTAGYQDIVQGTRGEEDLKKNSEYNALTRTFYIGYPAMLIKHGSNLDGTEGSILWQSTKIAIPRLLWRSKATYIQEDLSEEYAAYIAFKLPRYIMVLLAPRGNHCPGGFRPENTATQGTLTTAARCIGPLS